MFANHLVCKDFFKRMKKETELFGCDESIYNLGCLRIMGSTKKGEERILEPVQYRINKKLTKPLFVIKSPIALQLNMIANFLFI